MKIIDKKTNSILNVSSDAIAKQLLSNPNRYTKEEQKEVKPFKKASSFKLSKDETEE